MKTTDAILAAIDAQGCEVIEARNGQYRFGGKVNTGTRQLAAARKLLAAGIIKITSESRTRTETGRGYGIDSYQIVVVRA